MIPADCLTAARAADAGTDIARQCYEGRVNPWAAGPLRWPAASHQSSGRHGCAAPSLAECGAMRTRLASTTAVSDLRADQDAAHPDKSLRTVYASWL